MGFHNLMKVFNKNVSWTTNNKAISLEKKEDMKAKEYIKYIEKFFQKCRVQKRLEALNILKQINNLHPPQEDIDKLIKLFNQKHFSSVIEQYKL